MVRVAVATLGLLAATAVTSPAPGRADTNYPVLLVHGGTGNPGNFKEMEQRLAADGYRPFTVNLGFPGVDTARNADVISAEVDKILAATGASKVHLVGHSMGGLSTRYYIKMLNGLSKVATYTAFGTPQHGNPRHTCQPWEPVPDQCPNGKVMKDLNAGDDTPGVIYYTSIASKQAHPEEANGTWHPLDQGACLPATDRRRAARRGTEQPRDLPSGEGRTQLDLPDRMDQPARRVEQPTELVIRWTVERAPVIRGAGRNSRPRRMDLPFAATAVARSILSSPETAPVSPGWSG